MLLNTPDGVIGLKTRESRPHQRQQILGASHWSGQGA